MLKGLIQKAYEDNKVTVAVLIATFLFLIEQTATTHECSWPKNQTSPRQQHIFRQWCVCNQATVPVCI